MRLSCVFLLFIVKSIVEYVGSITLKTGLKNDGVLNEQNEHPIESKPNDSPKQIVNRDTSSNKGTLNKQSGTLPKGPTNEGGDGMKKELLPSSANGIEENENLADEAETCEILNIETPVQSVKGLEYLGCGYDSTKSMPFGDEESFLDSGYTQPVVNFQWPCRNRSKINPMPIGVWIRQEPSCHRGHEKRMIKNKETLVSILSEDVESFLGIANFGVNYVMQNKEIAGMEDIVKKHMFALKSNCAMFTTGMILSSKWNVTRAFENATKEIESYPDKEKCDTQEKYLSDAECKNYCELWKKFFMNYGTHVISRITMGGKILQMDEMENTANENAESNDKKHNISVNVGVLSGSFNLNNTNEKQQKEKVKKKNGKFFIMGGDTFIPVDTPEGFRDWVDSIKENSMPINVELTPMSQFMPIGIRRHYWFALKSYSGS